MNPANLLANIVQEMKAKFFRHVRKRSEHFCRAGRFRRKRRQDEMDGKIRRNEAANEWEVRLQTLVADIVASGLRTFC